MCDEWFGGRDSKNLKVFHISRHYAKNSWWIYLMNKTVFLFGTPSNLYLVFYENACEKENRIEGVTGEG